MCRVGIEYSGMTVNNNPVKYIVYCADRQQINIIIYNQVDSLLPLFIYSLRNQDDIMSNKHLSATHNSETFELDVRKNSSTNIKVLFH